MPDKVKIGWSGRVSGGLTGRRRRTVRSDIRIPRTQVSGFQLHTLSFTQIKVGELRGEWAQSRRTQQGAVIIGAHVISTPLIAIGSSLDP